MSVVLRPAVAADYPRIAAIISSQNPEPVTAEEMLREEALLPKDDPYIRMVAVNPDGLIVGAGSSSGGRLQKPGEFRVHVRVDEGYRRQGIGTALYEALASWAQEHGASARLVSSVRETNPADVAWSERRGFVKEHHLFESVLDLTTFDPTPFLGALEAAQAAGIRFTTLAAEGTDEANLRRWFAFCLEMNRDVPGSEGRPEITYELWHKFVVNNPRWDPAMVFLALDGDRPVAYAEVSLMESGGRYNSFTAVHRDYRGRGLAMAIKVEAIRQAKAAGAPYIRTNNHSVNQRMLAVNRKMGYVPQPGFFTIYKPL